MRTATDWFDLYGASHQNKTNKLIHWICIPLILLASLGLVQAIPHPFGDVPGLHWASICWAICLLFYASLSWTVFGGMLLWGAVFIGLNTLIAATGLSLAGVSATIFVLAWIAQFYGHKVEGKKPSFFQDVQFLLVGPAWLLQFVYRRMGIPVETRAAQA